MTGRVSPQVWAGCGLMVAVFVVYAVTLTPGVPPTDSGELALAAWLPGVAHAPGFPLYVVLSWLWMHLLPIGRVIWRLNLLSAVCGALAAGLTYTLALRTLRRDGRANCQFALQLAAAVAALTLALGRTVWLWATVAEVYALNLALTAAILLLVLGWSNEPAPRAPREPVTRTFPPAMNRRAKSTKPAKAGSHQPPTPPGGTANLSHASRSTLYAPRNTPHASRPTLCAAALLFGLGLGNHLTSIALLAPAIAYWLTGRRGWRFWLSKTALIAALALIAGAAIYLYLPLRAVADPLLNWGDPDTGQRFWWHVTAKQYRVSLLSAPVWPQVVLTGQLWWTQFTPLGLILLAVGAWRMVKTQRPLFWTLLLVIVFTTLYAWAYVIEDDGDAYYLPAFLAGAVWVAWGAEAAVGWLMERKGRGPGGVRFAVLLIPALALVMNWPACDRRRDTIPEDYVRDAFAEIGPNGLLLTRDWQLYSPALYLQRIENLRPDLIVIDTELLRRRWYFDYLHAAAPDLMRSVAEEERRFLALRDAWERGEIPDRDPRIGQLQAAYVALIDAFIRQANTAGWPVHIGPNRGAGPFRATTLAGQPDMEPGVGTGWRWVPVGLSFRATASPTLPREGERMPPLVWRVEPFQRVVPTAPEYKVQASRADMATLRGLYLAQTGNPTAAEADWLAALAVDPAHTAAKELLSRRRATQ